MNKTLKTIWDYLDLAVVCLLMTCSAIAIFMGSYLEGIAYAVYLCVYMQANHYVDAWKSKTTD